MTIDSIKNKQFLEDFAKPVTLVLGQINERCSHDAAYAREVSEKLSKGKSKSA